MKAVLAAVAAILAVASAPTGVLGAYEIRLGSEKCTWGPSYWCSGFPAVRECGALDHCIQRVWSDQTLPEDNDDVCTICKNMVKEARDTLRSNETQVGGLSEFRAGFIGKR